MAIAPDFGHDRENITSDARRRHGRNDGRILILKAWQRLIQAMDWVRWSRQCEVPHAARAFSRRRQKPDVLGPERNLMRVRASPAPISQDRWSVTGLTTRTKARVGRSS